MAQVIITFKIMPEKPDCDLNSIQEQAEQFIKEFGGEVGKVEKAPVGFGLIALVMMFVMDESLGSTEELEDKIQQLKDVASVEVTDVRRAIG
ncbi:elongation factor 1-beta [Candidatus Woesearchaeota archaeon]|nr:elongation factor 1-beta [Candidatus Woesearchaeota archaeon]